MYNAGKCDGVKRDNAVMECKDEIEDGWRTLRWKRITVRNGRK